MPQLDGSETIKPVPFDHLEQVIRGPHKHSKENSYEAVEYEYQEEPKAAEEE